MAQPKNILREAVADSKAIKAAALKNAESLVLEHLKENVKSLVENVLNEEEEKAESAEDEKEEVNESAVEGEGNYDNYRHNPIHEGENDGMDKEHEKAHEDLEGGLDLAELGEEEDEAADEDEVGEDEGLSETDLEEALAEALNLDKVKTGDLGEDEWIADGKHPTGLLDHDKKEEGWEKKEPTAKLDLSIKEHRVKIASLVKENVVLRKANSILKTALEETKLFNHKLLYAHKLMQREGLSGDMKKKIISKMDEAKSVNEVKNLFESLDMALSAVMAESTKAQKTEKRSSLAEALGSASGTKSGKGVSVLTEQSDLAKRWQHVSGITKE